MNCSVYEDVLSVVREQIEIGFPQEITKEYLINKLRREIANLRISKMNFDFYKKVQENEIELSKRARNPQ